MRAPDLASICSAEMPSTLATPYLAKKLILQPLSICKDSANAGSTQVGADIVHGLVDSKPLARTESEDLYRKEA